MFGKVNTALGKNIKEAVTKLDPWKSSGNKPKVELTHRTAKRTAKGNSPNADIFGPR